MNPPAEPAVPERVELLSGIPYGTGGGQALLLDLARPRNRPPHPLPAVVFIHGGGWRAADRSNGLPIILLLAEHGIAGASIDYRLSDIAGFPSQLEDCKCAVRFLRAHAEEYGIDPQRLGSAGGSAGGHLASLVGLVPGNAGLEGEGGWESFSSHVSAVASLYGISDVAALARENTAGDCAVQFMRGTPEELPELYQLASPLTWVSGQAPPFYLTHGDSDRVVLKSHSEKFAEALRAVNVPAELRMIPGMDHGSIGTLPEIVRTDIVRFFRKNL